jgi:TPR repeat protein
LIAVGCFPGEISMSFRTGTTVTAFFVFVLVSAARAQAPVQTSAKATAAPQANDIDSLREAASAGDAQAQFALADQYYRGVGVPQDYRQALLWFENSANQGFAPAQNQLGNMYEHKFGVPRDYKRAVVVQRRVAVELPRCVAIPVRSAAH